MPAVSTSLRILTGAIVAVLLVTGCETIGEANRVIGRADLVNDLAARLDRASELTYSADYQLPGGQTASIIQTQQPLRAAYTYPGGKLMVTAEATAECDTTRSKATCTLTPPPSPNTEPTAALLTRTDMHGLITPPVVISLLTAAALDAGAVIEQSDTTVAGRHATCVRVTEVTNAAASSFDACITTEGALGSFTGVVDGTLVDIALNDYRDAVDDTVFELPNGAGVIDRRPVTG